MVELTLDDAMVIMCSLDIANGEGMQAHTYESELNLLRKINKLHPGLLDSFDHLASVVRVKQEAKDERS